jgi:uncharacterized cysteine cluster protein YcgN (CxxCxxCC family)
MVDPNFWRRKSLPEMTEEEWESLCDGCGKCCLVKLEDEDTGEIAFTEAVCRLFDRERCRCTRYAERDVLVPTCVRLTPGNLARLSWMPSTCAYRLIAQGRELPWWHHLVSGDRDTIHQAGESVRGRCVSETEIPEEDLEDHVVTWPE